MPPSYFRQLNVLLLITGLCVQTVSSQSLVEYLPGFPGKLPFTLETGYTGLGESEEIQLFYYFVESERSPENDPLILWLQGGPACSAFSGLVLEMGIYQCRARLLGGPLMFDYTDTDSTIPSLVLNPYSWTKISNVIFLDQPVGTGFSYAESPEAYNTNEATSAKLIYEFLQKWIINHPKYKKNPLYIAGESFCGMIIPLIIDQIYNGIKAGIEPQLNIKGYTLGNPFTDNFIDANGRVPYAYRMGLISDEIYQSTRENCNGNYVSIEPNNHQCKNDIERVVECVAKINSYHILEPWCDIVSEERVPSLEYLLPEDENNARRSLQSVAPKSQCRAMNYFFLYKWANIKRVQQALHIREGTKSEWVRCNTTLKSESFALTINSSINFHKKIVDQTNYRALIYSGDHDIAVPHLATEEWIKSLNLQIKRGWRPWFVEGQVAGYTTTYFNGDSELTYTTVKGAGHTASEYKPLECLSMIDRWLSGNSL